MSLATATAIIMIGLSSLLEPASGPVVAESARAPVAKLAPERPEPERAAAQPENTGDAAATLVKAETWELDYSVTLTQTLPNAPNGIAKETKAAAGLKARLTVAPRSDLGTEWAAIRLSEIVATVDPALRASWNLTADGAQPEARFLVRRDTVRGIVERREDAGVSVLAASVLPAIIPMIQLVGPVSADADEWQVTEEEPSGPFEAQYARRRSESGATSIEKRWQARRGVSPALPDQEAPVLSSGYSVFTLGAEGPTVVKHTGRMEAGFGPTRDDDPAGMDLLVEVTLTARRIADSPDLAWATAPGLRVPEEAHAPVERMVAVAGDRGDPIAPELLAMTTEALLARAGAAATDDRADRRQVRRALTQRLESSPADVLLVRDRLLGSPQTGTDPQTLVEALSSAKSPEARAAFTAVIATPTAPEAHRQLAASAATFVTPDEDLLATLERVSALAGHDEVASSALLALGGMSRSLAETQPELAKAIGDRVLERAGAILLPPLERRPPTAPETPSEDPRPEQPAPESTPAVVMTWLDAVGNVGGPDAWPLVKHWIGSSDIRIRRIAVDNLRFIPTVDARKAIAEIIDQDPDPWVRRVAVQATGYQPQVVFEEVVLRALARDQHHPVRISAASVLATWGHSSPGLLDAIRDAAEREANGEYRRHFLDLLPKNHDQMGRKAQAGGQP